MTLKPQSARSLFIDPTFLIFARDGETHWITDRFLIVRADVLKDDYAWLEDDERPNVKRKALRNILADRHHAGRELKDTGITIRTNRDRQAKSRSTVLTDDRVLILANPIPVKALLRAGLTPRLSTGDAGNILWFGEVRGKQVLMAVLKCIRPSKSVVELALEDAFDMGWETSKENCENPERSKVKTDGRSKVDRLVLYDKGVKLRGWSDYQGVMQGHKRKRKL